jgi:transketolase
MPCWETFLAQPADYQDAVLPPHVAARVCVEAASPLGWHRFAGDGGEVIGMETFGGSAPAAHLFKHFGFTPERVAQAARAAIERNEA